MPSPSNWQPEWFVWNWVLRNWSVACGGFQSVWSRMNDVWVTLESLAVKDSLPNWTKKKSGEHQRVSRCGWSINPLAVLSVFGSTLSSWFHCQWGRTSRRSWIVLHSYAVIHELLRVRVDWKILSVDPRNIKAISFKLVIYINLHIICEWIRNAKMMSNHIPNYPNIYENWWEYGKIFCLMELNVRNYKINETIVRAYVESFLQRASI
jgi:hypothetical protein